MNTPTSDFPIPLPAPCDFEDYEGFRHDLPDFDPDPIDTSGGIEHGPFLPTSAHEVNNLFNDTEDNQESSENGMFFQMALISK